MRKQDGTPRRIHAQEGSRIEAQIAREGFVYLSKRGKGSHERWRHPLLGTTLTVSGKDGDDVPLYLEKQLAKLLTALEELREDEDS